MNAETQELKPRPVQPERMNARAAVWFRREVSARELADMTGAPTYERVEQCAALLDKVQRYALADARHWEEEQDPRHYNADGTPKAAFKHAGELLKARRERLNAALSELSGGSLKLHNFGEYPSITNQEGTKVYCLLHYFD